MYWWNIEALKQDLAHGALPGHGGFVYFFAVLVVDSLMIATWGLFPTAGEGNVWDYLYAGGYLLIVLTGTLILYRRNGGARGKLFLERYFPLLWVVGVRFLVFSVPLMLLWIIWSLNLEAEDAVETGPENVASLAVFILYYWRLAVHLGQVRAAARG
jgi:hypothetical protein